MAVWPKNPDIHLFRLRVVKNIRPIAMNILLISSSPNAISRSGALLQALSQKLEKIAGSSQQRLVIRDLPAQSLLHADWNNATLAQAIAAVDRADALVIATPVYKAAYSGLLKAFLDLLPQYGLRDKAVLPLATGGSPNHMLALDYALRPVLQSMGPRLVLPSVYAVDSQITTQTLGGYQIAQEVQTRLDEVVALLAQARTYLASAPRTETAVAA